MTSRVVALARSLGFDLAGVCRAEPSRETRFFREWIERGYAGEMHYLERRQEERVDPRLVLEGVRSMLVVGLRCPQNGPNERVPEGSGHEPLRGRTARGRVARYAGGEDYHGVMRERLLQLAEGLHALAVGRALRTRVYVDTGPVLERVFAARAGLGWIGKNSCLIHPEIGSHVLLGVLLCSLDLTAGRSAPVQIDRCGGCRACLDACPTQAFEAPRVLDARRCIAYWTIEASEIPPSEQRLAHADWVFGCDVCQDVCPWNRRLEDRPPAPDPLGLRERLRPARAWQRPPLEDLLALDRERWLEASRHTALRRLGHAGLLRNALVAAGNARDPSLRSSLERWARPEGSLADEGLRDLARAALRESLPEVVAEDRGEEGRG